MPNDPTPSPLEGIEIPEYERLEDVEISGWFDPETRYDGPLDTIDKAFAELAERRLADRMSDKDAEIEILLDENERLRKRNGELRSKLDNTIGIPKDVAAKMAQGLERLCRWVDKVATPEEIDDLSEELEDVVPILRGENPDAR